MEALLLVVDVGLFVALLFAIRRNEGSAGHNELGWFSYIEDTRSPEDAEESPRA